MTQTPDNLNILSKDFDYEAFLKYWRGGAKPAFYYTLKPGDPRKRTWGLGILINPKDIPTEETHIFCEMPYAGW